jgi:hypothetical protein
MTISENLVESHNWLLTPSSPAPPRQKAATPCKNCRLLPAPEMEGWASRPAHQHPCPPPQVRRLALDWGGLDIPVVECGKANTAYIKYQSVKLYFRKTRALDSPSAVGGLIDAQKVRSAYVTSLPSPYLWVVYANGSSERLGEIAPSQFNLDVLVGVTRSKARSILGRCPTASPSS